MTQLNMKSSDYINSISKEYALYVGEHRAIPKASDGLKDGQRKALYLLSSKSDKIKTISLAGEMISSNLYLHGDAAAADSISRLAAPFLNNIPLISGIGTFGTLVDPTGISAPRYTYVKRTQVTQRLMYPDSNIVPMKDNYDGSRQEPVTFLPIVPVVLLNGINGIAVGYSTEILPHTLSDVIDCTLKVLDGKGFKDMTPNYEYLDCEVENEGDGKWTFYGKFKELDTSTLHVESLPPDLPLEKFREHLDTLIEKGTINDYTDNTSEKVDIDIKFKRGTLVNYNKLKLRKLLKIHTKKTERLVVLDFDGKSIRTFDDHKSLIQAFVDFRFTFYIKRYQEMKRQAEYNLRYQNAIKKCFDTKMPNQILSKKTRAEVIQLVSDTTKTEGVDQDQINSIAGLPSYSWSNEYYHTCLQKIKDLKNQIKEYDNLLNNHDLIKDIYKEELKDLKKLKYKREV